MNIARIVFPGFWFGQSDLAEAVALARRGVGGFCVYGGTAQQTAAFVQQMREASPYNHLLICADMDEDLREVVTDAPALPSNAQLGACASAEGAYKKGNMLACMARSIGIDWVLAPVADLGYSSPAFSVSAPCVTRLAGDFVAGLSNGGALNCVKYFPGVSGILKTLAQMEDAEFMPYKSLFRRADAIMPSDMTFPNIDGDTQAMMSDKILRGLLKKRLNYKGCIVSFPLWKARVRYEGAAALKMLHCGVENILAPKDPHTVLDAIEREVNKGFLMDEIIHAVSNHEMAISKLFSAPVLSMKEAFLQAETCFNK